MIRFTLAVIGALIVSASASAKGTDPRVCNGSRLQCGKDFTVTVLRSYEAKVTNDPNWDAVIACRGYAGLLRYRCTWHNGLGKGAAFITYSPTSFKPTVTAT